MDFKDAYKQAFTEELKPLVDSGKIVLLGTLEDLAEEITKKVFVAVKKGAVLSSTPYDDIIVPPVANMLEARLLKEVDKIDGEVGAN